MALNVKLNITDLISITLSLTLINLKSPLNGEMISKVNESLLASMKVKYSEGNNTLIKDSGSYAGMKLVGLVEILLE